MLIYHDNSGPPRPLTVEQAAREIEAGPHRDDMPGPADLRRWLADLDASGQPSHIYRPDQIGDGEVMAAARAGTRPGPPRHHVVMTVSADGGFRTEMKTARGGGPRQPSGE